MRSPKFPFCWFRSPPPHRSCNRLTVGGTGPHKAEMPVTGTVVTPTRAAWDHKRPSPTEKAKASPGRAREPHSRGQCQPHPTAGVPRWPAQRVPPHFGQGPAVSAWGACPRGAQVWAFPGPCRPPPSHASHTTALSRRHLRGQGPTAPHQAGHGQGHKHGVGGTRAEADGMRAGTAQQRSQCGQAAGHQGRLTEGSPLTGAGQTERHCVTGAPRWGPLPSDRWALG